MIKKYKEFITESIYSEYPYQYNTMDTSDGKEGSVEFHKKNNIFQSIQNELKELILVNNSSMDESDIENELRKFFELGNNKVGEVREISDNCKDVKKCAKEIYDKFIKYVILNGDEDNINDVEQDSVMESKLNGKYGFFMFLGIIDEMKNSFIKENYLNIKDFNIFFTTDKISDKNKLTNLIEYKKSIDVAFATIKHIRNLRLSFYFGVKDFVVEYGFHDDLKRMIYKVGEFKTTSIIFNNLSSYKCISMIYNILKVVKLKDLELLQNVKNDIKYLFDNKFNDIIIEGDKVIKKINNIELDNYYKGDNIMSYFDSWSFKYKWYYSTYNYIDTDDEFTHFYVKIRPKDDFLNKLKKDTDIKNLKRIQEDKETISSEIFEPLTREPLESPNLKMFKKDKRGNVPKKEEKEKELIKYFKLLKKVINSINKDKLKNKSYITKYLYNIVGVYNKPFKDVKLDLQWMVGKLKESEFFIEEEEEKLLAKSQKKQKKQKKKKK